MTELAKAYDPKGVEERWYAFWDERGYFRGDNEAAKAAPDRRFSMVIPPPNVTGALHVGHALNNSIQDTLARRARMQGRPTLWVPGTDHAAIATQNVLERRLADEGLTRFDLGREAFEARFWTWKDEYEARILGQLRRMGCSCDWTRTRFTMDEGLSHAVRTVFVRLYDEGAIYRGNRIINWCPRCTSAISDIEVNHIDTPGEIVTLRYPLAGGSGSISVSTTRVETMLGDTGVAVHPDDDRYAALIGKTVILPLVGREIPIVADAAVDPSFGTGAVKVTPAHDPNDFDIAQRNGLEAVNIFDETATVNDNGGPFEGLGRYEARTRVLEALRAEGVVEAEERPYVHAVGHCDRCGTEIEPWLSEQWFMAMKDLARPAIDAVRDGRVRFVPPEPYERMYLTWMENIRDWCVSRQLWLGHRIPAWYCPDGHITVSMEDPDACATCGSSDISQEQDTLDTWFSSGLWPFSTLGWPEDTDDLRTWYPTTVLSTAREILYLWVARMIFLGMHFVGEVPFHDVVIHPIVRDAEGRKMSKTLGNVLDPLDAIDRYGTDAVRLGLLRGCVLGQDMSFAEDRVESARRFCNKLWNASRFVLSNIEGNRVAAAGAPTGLPERWIMSRLHSSVAAFNDAMDAYTPGEAARVLYELIWTEYCDWYLEMAKLRLPEADGPVVAGVLLEVLETSLRLAHPMMPFITEEIWQRLPKGDDAPRSVMIASWPEADAARIDPDAEKQMAFLQLIVVEVRRFRHEHGLPPQQRIDAVVHADAQQAALIEEHREELRSLARLGSLTVGPRPGDGWSRVLADGAEIYLPLSELVDVAAERARLVKEIADTDTQAERSRAKLANESFTSKAPAAVVDKARAKVAELDGRLSKLRAQLDQLGGAAGD